LFSSAHFPAVDALPPAILAYGFIYNDAILLYALGYACLSLSPLLSVDINQY